LIGHTQAVRLSAFKAFHLLLSTMLFYIAAFLALGCALAAVLFRGVRSRNMADWFFFFGCLTLIVDNLLLAWTAQSDVVDAQSLQGFRLTLLPCLGLVWLMFALTFSRGNSLDYLKNWKLPLACFALAGVSLPIVAAFSGGHILQMHVAPDGSEWALLLTAPGRGVFLVSLAISCLILMNLEQTLRAAVGRNRWRIKYMIFGVGLLFGVRIYTDSQAVVYSGLLSKWQILNAAGLVVAFSMAGISLRRQGRFEVDIYPSSAVLHKSLIVVLVGIYLVALGVLAKATTVLGGHEWFPLQAFLIMVGLAGLAVFLFSERLRREVGTLISRHFKRPAYDSITIWRTFTEKTGSLVHQADLCKACVQFTSTAFNALSVTMWLAHGRNSFEFGASTSLTKQDGPPGMLRIQSGELTEEGEKKAAQEGNSLHERCTMSKEGDAVHSLLFPGFPAHMPKTLVLNQGRTQALVPVAFQGELLGLLLLQERVNHLPFSTEEVDMLNCIARQLGADLSRLRLSGQLLQAKELEAFQSMSAFLVHDLKNMASSLSLLLENFQEHFSDPDFRADAISAVSNNVKKLSGTIRKLGGIRERLEFEFTEVNLNEIVQATVQSLNGIREGHLQTDLSPVPNIKADAEQIRKLLVNLILNAKEALTGEGVVRVQTGTTDSCAMISVSDTGCGMTADFVRNCLFRPFQTTKKNGLGIGMFHCKAIVEAHRGKIEVETMLGKGSVFRIRLPLSSQ
jgi:putative PEP-CTERM system histidine kinase